LNDVHSFRVRGAFLELHCLAANNAAKEIDQRAFIVVGSRVHFPFAFQTASVCQPLRKFGAPFVRRAIKEIPARTTLRMASGFSLSMLQSLNTHSVKLVALCRGRQATCVQ